MAKRIVVCCDGTWNTPDELSGGGPAPTNVTRLSLAIPAQDAGGTEQCVLYHRGVGTKRSERFRGGVFGYGLSRDVRDVYRYLAATYEPGDELFFFGFSRGAYTARSAVGFVRNCGILRPEHRDAVDDAFALYRRQDAEPGGIEAKLFRRTFSFETRIHFIGVWDTVGALGIPVSGLPLINWLNRGNRFHDTKLSTTVDAAFQALAIDEQRGPFRPSIWNQQASDTPQEVEQVWFTGVHSDVGGGYASHGLSDVTLMWMVANAVRYGLDVDHTILKAGPFVGTKNEEHGVVDPNALGQLHESRNGVYKAVPAFKRTIVNSTSESASSSSVARTTAGVGYQPANLLAYLRRPDHRLTDVD